MGISEPVPESEYAQYVHKPTTEYSRNISNSTFCALRETQSSHLHSKESKFCISDNFRNHSAYSKSPNIAVQRRTIIPQSKLDRLEVTKSLNLEKSKLNAIPSNLFSIDNLEIVNLNDNAIRSIPEEVIPPFTDPNDEEKKSSDNPQHKKSKKSKGKYKGIKVFRINNNRLSALPLSFVNLQNIQTLQMDGNQFEYFPSILLQLPKLKELSMKKNQIQIIECSLELVEGVKKLTALDLSYNRLQVLPDEFCHFRSVEVVNLECNYIGQLPVSWKEMKALHIINLKGNRLEDIPKSLFLETNVVRVDMEDNPVHSKKKYVHLEGWNEVQSLHHRLAPVFQMVLNLLIFV